MSDILPPQLQIFLELIRPLRNSFRVRLAQSLPLPSLYVQDFPSYITEQLDLVNKQIQTLDKHFNGSLNAIVVRSDVKRENIQIEINKLDVTLSNLLSLYQDAVRHQVPLDCAEGQRLLRGTIRYFLTQAENWLDNIVDTLEDPVAACRKRGLPTSGRVELEMTLDMSPDVNLNDLQIWVKEYVRVKRGEIRAAQRNSAQGLGFFGTIAALWLGSEIIEHFFGDKD
jgi:hypothetical protein